MSRTNAIKLDEELTVGADVVAEGERPVSPLEAWQHI